MRRSGFTLVEVMVVLAVTAMLSALILVYNASTRETLRLFTEKARVAQLILRSKSLALSTYVQEGEAPCGYGIRFDRKEDRYALVAYMPPSCADRTRVDTDDSSFQVAEQSDFALPATLTFEDIDAAQDLSYVLFIPPDPTVLLARADGSLVDNGTGKVGLVIKGRTTDAIVIVNAAGQVTF